jgi:hypothetical protein
MVIIKHAIKREKKSQAEKQKNMAYPKDKKWAKHGGTHL